MKQPDGGFTSTLKIIGGLIVSIIAFGMFAWFAGPWTFIPMAAVGALIWWKLDSTVGGTVVAMAVLTILVSLAG